MKNAPRGVSSERRSPGIYGGSRSRSACLYVDSSIGKGRRRTATVCIVQTSQTTIGAAPWIPGVLRDADKNASSPPVTGGPVLDFIWGDLLLHFVAGFLRAFLNVVADVFHALLDTVPGLLGNVACVFGCVLGGVGSLVGGFIDTMLGLLGYLLCAVLGVFGCVLGGVGSLVGGFIDTMLGFLDHLFGAVGCIFGCVLGGIGSLVGRLIRGIHGFLGCLLGSVRRVFGRIGSLVGRLVNVSFDVLRIPERCQTE